MKDKFVTGNLDLVLKVLYDCRNSEFETIGQIQIKLSKFTLTEIKIILDYLSGEEFLLTELKSEQNCDTIELYKISLKGILFFESTSFKKRRIIQKMQKAYAIAKIIWTTISTVAIISITFFQWKATERANIDRETVFKMSKTIDSLNKLINTKITKMQKFDKGDRVRHKDGTQIMNVLFYMKQSKFVGPDSLIGQKQRIQIETPIVKCEWLDTTTNKSITGEFHENLLIKVD